MEVIQRYSESVWNKSSSPVDFTDLQTKLIEFIERPYKLSSLELAYSTTDSYPGYEPITMDELHEVLLAESLIAFKLIDNLRKYERKTLSYTNTDSRDVDVLFEKLLTRALQKKESSEIFQQGGVAGVESMIALVIFEIISDIGHYGEMYAKNIEMKTTNQTIMVTKIDKNIIKSLTKKVKERFISYFNQDGKVLLSKAPALRQMLRVEYSMVIAKNIPVEKLQFYKRMIGEESSSTVQYTYGDLVFDILIKANVHEDTIQRVATQRIGRSASQRMQLSNSSTSKPLLSKFFNMFKRKTTGKIHPLPRLEVYRDLRESSNTPLDFEQQQAGAKKRKYIRKTKK